MRIDRIERLLAQAIVIEGMRNAWTDSLPGHTGGHEEGGFVLSDQQGLITIERWPRGAADWIDIPPHPNGRFSGRDIVATFHTHPNTGVDYQQEPNKYDIDTVTNDPDLVTPSFLGEFVVSENAVYWIAPDGRVVQFDPLP